MLFFEAGRLVFVICDPLLDELCNEPEADHLVNLFPRSDSERRQRFPAASGRVTSLPVRSYLPEGNAPRNLCKRQCKSPSCGFGVAVGIGIDLISRGISPPVSRPIPTPIWLQGYSRRGSPKGGPYLLDDSVNGSLLTATCAHSPLQHGLRVAGRLLCAERHVLIGADQ